MSNLHKPHVVALPFSALGHSIPCLDLAKLLASHGLTVSFITTPANVTRLQQSIEESTSSALDIRLLVLPTPSVEGLPHGLESTDLLPPQSSGLIFEMAGKLSHPFNAWMDAQFHPKQSPNEEELPPPVCIIYDIVMVWAVETANKYNIACVIFNTCGAFSTSLLHSVADSISRDALQKEDNNQSLVLSWNLPYPLRLQRHEIAPKYFDPDTSSPRLQSSIGRLLAIADSSGMLLNTFEGLEPAYVEHLRNITGKPVWPIGPLILLAAKFGGVRGKSTDISDSEIIQWLDAREPHTVLYVSFGSQASLSAEQTRSLARGIEASGQAFIWAIKVPPGIEPATSSTDLRKAFLPPGFEERTREMGLVVWGWSPQLAVLSHPSIGAFLSHCGWNSTVESVSMGVPLIAWPMFGDQHTNSRLVRDLGVGVQVCEHTDGIPEEERVKEAVKLVLEEDEGKEMMKRAQKLKEMASEGAGDGGSSAMNLQAFVQMMQTERFLQ